MIRCISKLARSALSPAPTTKLSSFPPPPQPLRRLLYCEINVSNSIPHYHEMIKHANALPKVEKTEEKFSQGLLMLEQCLSQQSEEDEDDLCRIHMTKGMCSLAMANLLYAKGAYVPTLEKLRKVQEAVKSEMDLKVAALEAFVALNLELGRDEMARVLAETCVSYMLAASDMRGSVYAAPRALAITGFANLVFGNIERAESSFEGFEVDERFVVPPVLSYGELLHVKQNFTAAKDVYTKIIDAFKEDKVFTREFTVTYGLAGCGMAPAETYLATTCALGQLEAQMGNFDVGEKILTEALTMAENLHGHHHPKVGVVLTCFALMLKHKAVKEQSSSLLIQEGLYRKALDYLKAPPVDSEDFDATNGNWDIMALARGGYADVLSVQENRRSEGEKMRGWAEAAWRNKRMTLAEALSYSKSPDKVAVVDTRCCRIL